MACYGMSVGVLIHRGEYGLFIKRRRGTPGWAPPAGHHELGENSRQTGVREVGEEVSLLITSDCIGDPILVETFDDRCRHGTKRHSWWVYEVEVPTGDPVRNEQETLDMRWVPLAEWAVLDLEQVWRTILTKTGHIKEETIPPGS